MSTGQQRDFAAAGELGAHLKQRPQEAHGIWPLVKEYVDTKPAYIRMIDPVALTLTMDGNDHDLDLTTQTSARTSAVFLELRQTYSGTAGRWVKVKTKKRGASSWDHPTGGMEIFDSTGANCRIPHWSEQWIQRVDSGQELTYNISQEGVTEVYLVGYVEQGG